MVRVSTTSPGGRGSSMPWHDIRRSCEVLVKRRSIDRSDGLDMSRYPTIKYVLLQLWVFPFSTHYTPIQLGVGGLQ